VSYHSDALHIVERHRRVDANTLEIDATLEDPKVLSKPWIVPKQTLQLAPFDQIMEVGCSGIDTQSLKAAAPPQIESTGARHYSRAAPSTKNLNLFASSFIVTLLKRM
jgi:hypothetical protein